MEIQENVKGKEHRATHAREYAVKAEAELQKIRDSILAPMDKNLIQSTNNPKSMGAQVGLFDFVAAHRTRQKNPTSTAKDVLHLGDADEGEKAGGPASRGRTIGNVDERGLWRQQWKAAAVQHLGVWRPVDQEGEWCGSGEDAAQKIADTEVEIDLKELMKETLDRDECVVRKILCFCLEKGGDRCSC